MKLLWLVVPILFGGCSSYGSHPHYIISQDEVRSDTPIR